jgi:hypothetical protein
MDRGPGSWIGVAPCTVPPVDGVYRVNGPGCGFSYGRHGKCGASMVGFGPAAAWPGPFGAGAAGPGPTSTPDPSGRLSGQGGQARTFAVARATQHNVTSAVVAMRRFMFRSFQVEVFAIRSPSTVRLGNRAGARGLAARRGPAEIPPGSRPESVPAIVSVRSAQSASCTRPLRLVTGSTVISCEVTSEDLRQRREDAKGVEAQRGMGQVYLALHRHMPNIVSAYDAREEREIVRQAHQVESVPHAVEVERSTWPFTPVASGPRVLRRDQRLVLSAAQGTSFTTGGTCCSSW